jgi:hypothetical protein
VSIIEAEMVSAIATVILVLAALKVLIYFNQILEYCYTFG